MKFEIRKMIFSGPYKDSYFIVVGESYPFKYLCRDGKMRDSTTSNHADESLYYFPTEQGARDTVSEYEKRNKPVDTTKRVLVVGAGRQGTCVSFALIQLGYNVILQDSDANQLETASAKLYRVYGERCNEQLLVEYDNEHSVPIDAIVSCAPYHKNLDIAKKARGWKVPYVDLGGNVGVSKAIAELEGDSPVFTDVGLAPGLVSIIAENLYQMLVYNNDKADSISMAVGGLPVIPPNNRFRYNQVFSMDGLLNEYFDDCKMLRNGMELTVPGMSQYVVQPEGEYEAFATSGGLGSMLPLMKGRGVQNLLYRTLRYKGHRDAIEQLLVKWDKTNDRDRIAYTIRENCPPTTEDKVILGVTVDGDKFTVHYDNEWFFDENWTAMQKMTAFPVACVMSQMLQEPTRFSRVCDYSQVSYSELTTDLKKLGVSL